MMLYKKFIPMLNGVNSTDVNSNFYFNNWTTGYFLDSIEEQENIQIRICSRSNLANILVLFVSAIRSNDDALACGCLREYMDIWN